MDSCVMLPANWKEIDNSRVLIDRIKEVNVDKDISSVVEKLRNFKEQYSSTKEFSSMVEKPRNFKEGQKSSTNLQAMDSRVMLPANWRDIDNSRVLCDRIKEVNVDKDISSVVEKLKNCKEQ